MYIGKTRPVYNQSGLTNEETLGNLWFEGFSLFCSIVFLQNTMDGSWGG